MVPQSVHTIPRLELCTVVLAVELAEVILQELDIKADALKFYTDSKVMLGYISIETCRFYVYVSNRVQRIRNSTRCEQSSYIAISDNPADVATWPVSSAHLTETSWFSGPKFLQSSVSTHITDKASFNLICPDPDEEDQDHVIACIDKNTVLGSHRYERFSSWQSLLIAAALLIHVTQSFKKKVSIIAENLTHLTC